jgi:hypothetical protein
MHKPNDLIIYPNDLIIYDGLVTVPNRQLLAMPESEFATWKRHVADMFSGMKFETVHNLLTRSKFKHIGTTGYDDTVISNYTKRGVVIKLTYGLAKDRFNWSTK